MGKWEVPDNAELPEDLAAEVCRMYREAKSEDDAFWKSCGLEHRASDMSLSLTVWIRLSPVQRHIIMEQIGHDRESGRLQNKCQRLMLRYINREKNNGCDIC